MALVDLSEGARMMSRVNGVDPHKVRIGMSVKARVEVLPEDAAGKDPQPQVVFYPTR